MNRTIFAALLIIVGYLYGSTLYEPWYFAVQKIIVATGLIKSPPNAPKGTRLLGNQVQIVVVSLVLMGIGIWLFASSDT